MALLVPPTFSSVIVVVGVGRLLERRHRVQRLSAVNYPAVPGEASSLWGGLCGRGAIVDPH
uniref:Uncharacterized protein n=1 Tax=Arundo donax TaxID=35708 RepID=A0A0A9AAV7_ARUDO